MITSVLFVDPAEDPNRSNPEAHWRLYWTTGNSLITVCVQDFDYEDYAGRFVTTRAFESEQEAEDALVVLRQELRLLRKMMKNRE